MRPARLLAVTVLAVVLALSVAMPASAHINLLQNPGFETGSLAPYWVVSGDGEWDGGIGSSGRVVNPHGGTYFAWIDTADGAAGISQTLNHPQCAQYLEFWYAGFDEYGALYVYYSGESYARPPTQNLPPTPTWTFVHVDLDTAKHVEGVEISTMDGGTFSFDDFDLEACPAAAVGGVAMPANTLALVSPWLAVIGIVGCIGTIAVVAKKRSP